MKNLKYIELKVKNGNMGLVMVFLHSRFNNKPLGISFPEYNEDTIYIGNKIRVFGTEEELNSLFSLDFISLLKESKVHISDQNNVPECVEFIQYKRVQEKLSNSKINRIVKRNPEVSKKDLLKNSVLSSLNLPFLNIFSISSKKNYKIFIKKEKSDKYIHNYSSYGLSKENGSVPFF